MMKDARHTILIVDDDEEIVSLLRDHFKTRNCETIATADPATVVEKLKSFAVKLMLLDLKMKKLDGFQVLDKIKQADLPLPPTIIVTGFLAKYQDRLETYGIDRNDVVTKPFQFQVLEDCINRKLGSQVITAEVGSEYEGKIYGKNRCRIGIVEDEEDILTVLSDFFKERNYRVSCFKNGAAALDAFEGGAPVDILFVDIKLPGMQGDDLIAAIKKFKNPPHLISMSADPLSKEMRTKLEALDCRDFVEKPFDVVELIELVKTIAIKKGLLG